MATAVDWNTKGRGVHAAAPTRRAVRVTWAEAERRVLLALGSELLLVPMAERDAAITAATQGYLDVYRSVGGTMA